MVTFLNELQLNGLDCIVSQASLHIILWEWPDSERTQIIHACSITPHALQGLTQEHLILNKPAIIGPPPLTGSNISLIFIWASFIVIVMGLSSWVDQLFSRRSPGIGFTWQHKVAGCCPAWTPNNSTRKWHLCLVSETQPSTPSRTHGNMLWNSFEFNDICFKHHVVSVFCCWETPLYWMLMLMDHNVFFMAL